MFTHQRLSKRRITLSIVTFLIALMFIASGTPVSKSSPPSPLQALNQYFGNLHSQTSFSDGSGTDDNKLKQSANGINENGAQKDIPQSNNAQTDETPHTLVGSFYTVQGGINAKLLLNNKGITTLEVRPTLYNLAGQSLEIAPIFVEPRSFRFVDLQDWINVGGESFRSGSIKLFHSGKDLVLGAQIYLTDEAHSLSFEEKLAELSKFDSRRQEAVWYQPTSQTETQIALSNTSDAPLTITGRLTKAPRHKGDANVFELAPHQTRILDLGQDFSDGQQFANADVVGLSLEHAGAKDALLARALIRDSGRGYSNLAQFSNPTTGKSSEYQGVGFQVDKIEEEQLTPVIIAKNVGSQTATITAQVPFTREDETTGTINLPPTTLRAGEMRTLDVRQIVQRARQEQIKIAGLEITYDTAPGSVIVATHSQSANDNQVFRVPMWDPLGQRSPTGGYPWRIEGASTTKTYIKNITDREQYYVAYLTWENDGAYMIGMKKLLPHQTIEIDIKRLRDEQIPDEAGRIIPLDASSGQLKWSLKQTEEPPAGEEARQQLALIGRTEQIDTENGISSNYACQSCCGNSYYDGYIDPINREVEVGEQINYRAFQRDRDCNGDVTLPYQRITIFDGRTDWNSNNTSVATIGSDSNATATGPGQATIYASWQDYNNPQGTPCQSYLTQPDEEYISEGQETSENQAINIAPQLDFAEPPCENCTNNVVFPVLSVVLTVKPKVQKIQYQEPGTSTYVDIAGTLYVLKGTTVNFKAIPYPNNATFPTGQPTWSGTSGISGTGQTKSVTFNTISSSTSDYKTVSARTITPVTLNVIVYELTGVLMPQDNFAGRSLIRFGLEEIVNLSFAATPTVTASQTGRLRWSVQIGTGQLAAQDDGTGVFTASKSAESSTLKLEILEGPSKGQFVTKNITIVAPSSAYVAKFSNIAHNYGAFGGGFKGYIYLEPRDVSFSRIRFSEGAINATASGYLGFLNGYPHPMTFGTATIGYCNITTGCRTTTPDQIVISQDPAPAPHPTAGYVGNFHWAIPWRYHTTTSIVPFATGNHRCPSNNIGTAALEKQGAGPYFIAITDPTTGF